MNKILIILTAGTILCACSKEETEVIYRCANEEGPDIIIKAEFFEGGMHIDINSRHKSTLTQEISASGVRYAGTEGIEFWTKGDKAYYTSFGAGVDCVKE